jgi:hypothetical protein
MFCCYVENIYVSYEIFKTKKLHSIFQASLIQT